MGNFEDRAEKFDAEGEFETAGSEDNLFFSICSHVGSLLEDMVLGISRT